jgi:hypothetical protein
MNVTVTAQFEDIPAGLSTVYLDGSATSSGDGTTPETAVKTFEEAKALLSTTDGTIYVTGLVTISGSEEWSLDGYTNAEVMRDAGYTGYLITVPRGASLTLSNITLDGNKTNVTATASLVEVSSGTLTINNGAVLQNNSTSSGPGGVKINGTFSMNGGRISNNETTDTSTSSSGGGLYMGGGTFTMNGGEISNNTSPNGGGILLRRAITINGGTITGNTATLPNKGNAIYATQQLGVPSIGSDALIAGSICIAGNNSVNISGALVNSLTLAEYYAQSEGHDLIKGSGYTLTEADLSKINYEGEGWYLALNTDTNSIYLTQTPPTVVWDGSLDTSWYNTVDTSFTLGTPAQLAGLAAIVNGTAAGLDQDCFEGKTISLSGNVVLEEDNLYTSEEVYFQDGSAAYSGTFSVPTIDPEANIWTPIGNSTNQFKGIFDGNDILSAVCIPM